MHFFTSITTNYLPKARVLARSVKKHNPDAVFHLMLSDELPQTVNLEQEPFDSVIYPQDLGIPELDGWIFKHTVVELCTAVKGAAFLKILQENNADKGVYLDPDTVVFHELDELETLLDQHSVILTPHLVSPEEKDEAIWDNEICSLKHGVYNFGFLAVRNSEAGIRFLKWWRDRLLSYCYDDIPNGLFTDQRWGDLVPAMFDDVHVLRDKTYNVATWNISQRHVHKGENGQVVVEGVPLKFYHFSGFDSGSCFAMLGRYGQGNATLTELCNWYLKRIDEEGQKELGRRPSIYATYANGETITKEQRLLYRQRQDVQKAFPQPTEIRVDKNCYYDWYKSERPTTTEDVLKARLERVKAFFNRHPQLKKIVKALVKK